MILTFGQFFLLCLTALGPKREQKVHKKTFILVVKLNWAAPWGSRSWPAERCKKEKIRQREEISKDYLRSKMSWFCKRIMRTYFGNNALPNLPQKLAIFVWFLRFHDLKESFLPKYVTGRSDPLGLSKRHNCLFRWFFEVSLYFGCAAAGGHGIGYF